MKIKYISAVLFSLLIVSLLSSCASTDNIFSSIVGLGTPPGEKYCFVPSGAFCSDKEDVSSKAPEGIPSNDISITDYSDSDALSADKMGILPGNKDNTDAFSILLSRCSKEKLHAVTLKSGDYHLRSGGVLFENLKDFTFNGNGSHLIIHQTPSVNGKPLVAIRNCSGLLLKNITVVFVKESVKNEKGEPVDISPVAGVEVEHSAKLQFDEVKMSSLPTVGFLFKGTDVENIYMLKCLVTSCLKGIDIKDAGGRFFIKSCRFRNNAEGSVALTSHLPGYTFKTCFFYHNKGNDMTVSAPGVLIEDSTFIHSEKHAVSVVSDDVFSSRDIIIQENIFDGVGVDANNTNSETQDVNSVISLSLISGSGVGGAPNSDRILIAENKFMNFPGVALNAQSVSSLKVSGNLFLNRATEEGVNAGRYAGGILVDSCSNVVIRKNLWAGKGNKSKGVLFNPDTTTGILIEKNTQE